MLLENNATKVYQNLLDVGNIAQPLPTFSASTAHPISPHFNRPTWMPLSPPPALHCSMDISPITVEELVRAIKRSRPSSAPSLIDWIPHLIFKKCPSLQPALLDLTGLLWSGEFHPHGSWQSSS